MKEWAFRVKKKQNEKVMMGKRSCHVFGTERKSVLSWFRRVFQMASQEIILVGCDKYFFN